MVSVSVLLDYSGSAAFWERTVSFEMVVDNPDEVCDFVSAALRHPAGRFDLIDSRGDIWTFHTGTVRGVLVIPADQNCSRTV